MPTQRTYQCTCIYKKVHTRDTLLLLFKSTGYLSIAPRIVEAIPPPNKGERHSIRTCTIKRYHGSNHSILHTRIVNQYHREEKVWLQFHTICCKYLLSPFVLCFHLGSRICLRGRRVRQKMAACRKQWREN